MPEAYCPSVVFAALAFVVQGLFADYLPVDCRFYLLDCLVYPVDCRRSYLDCPDFGYLDYLGFADYLFGLDFRYSADFDYPDFGLADYHHSVDYLSAFVLPKHNYNGFLRHTDYF